MNQLTAPASKTNSRKQGRTKIANPKLASGKSVVVADAEAEISAEFVVGALLYSLLRSSRSEAVISFLPEEEQG